MYDNVVSYKRKKNQLHKAKFRKRRHRFIILLLSLLLILFTFSFYKLYKKIKCRDLQYSVEYNLTSGNSSERLLRVQHITLKYNDKEKVVVEVSGLDKEEPHKETNIRGTFKKDSFNSWILENAEKF